MATATLSKELLRAHPWPAQFDRDLLARCIDECLTCVQSCTACADACLAEDDVADLRTCITRCADCADVCVATARLLSRQTEFVPALARAQLASCWEQCALSARECERHADHHEHCRICAAQCRRCEEACAAVLEAIGQPA
jgi:hypothetical protein